MNAMKAVELPTNAYVHIDHISVEGPCRHKSLGTVIFTLDEQIGYVAAGASALRPKAANERLPYLQSKHVGADGYADRLYIDCCPPKVLQRHNVFGHSFLVDYAYAVFDQVTRDLGIEVSEADREEWRVGLVWLTEVHLTANFWRPEGDIIPIIDAIDESVTVGKHRDLPTAISIGYTPKNKRSKYHLLSLYGKAAQMKEEWKRPGPFRLRLLEYVTDSIRGEIKLFSMFLKRRNLRLAANWQDVDVAALFFEIFTSYRIDHAIQPLLTEDEIKLLSPKERNYYLLWMNGHRVDDIFSCRTTRWKYTKNILAKTGIDISSNRRPQKLPRVELSEVFSPNNILPVPGWLLESEYFAAPKT